MRSHAQTLKDRCCQLRSASLAAVLGVTAILGFNAEAKAVPIEENSSFSINGKFDYIPPLAIGSQINLDTLAELVPTFGTFLTMVSGTLTDAVPPYLLYTSGTDNEGTYFNVDYDTGSAAGTFEFTIGESTAYPIIPGPPSTFTIFGTLTMEDLDGYFDDAVGTGVFVGSFAEGSGLGTYSATFIFNPVLVPVPLPAALPMMAGGVVLLGGIGLRRKSKAIS